MKKWAKVTLIASSVVLSFSAVYGGLYIAYSVLNKKEKNNFSENVKSANETIESWNYGDTTFNSISSLDNQLLSEAIQQQIKDGAKDIISSVEIISEDLSINGEYTIEFRVDYIYKEEKNWTDSKSFTKTSKVKDFTTEQYALWTLKPTLVKNQLSYREYKSISKDNINNYIKIENPVDGINYRIEPNSFDSSKPSYIENNRIYVDIYVENPVVSNVEELHKSFVFDISILPPVVLTNQIVKENFNPDGIWANKKVLKYSDYYQYDYISPNAFNEIELDELELPSDASILDSTYNAINFSTVKKISILQTEEDTLFIKDNVVYAKEVYFDNQVIYFALTISDRAKQIDDLKVFDESFMQTIPNDQLPYNMVASSFYNLEVFTNVKRINLENSFIDYVADYAFSDCQKLSQNVKITNSDLFMDGINHIGYEAFANTNMSSLTIDNTGLHLGLSIDTGAFQGNNELQSVNILYGSLHLYIGGSCFNDNEKLTTVNIERVSYSPTLTWSLCQNIASTYWGWFEDFMKDLEQAINSFIEAILSILVILYTPTTTIDDNAFNFFYRDNDDIVPIDRTINITGFQVTSFSGYEIFGKCNSTTLNIEDWIDENQENQFSTINLAYDSSYPIFENITSLNIAQINNRTGNPIDSFNKDLYNDWVIDQNIIKQWNK